MKYARKAKWIVAALCFLCFLLLAIFLDALEPMDQAVYRAVYGTFASSVATSIFSFCSKLASSMVLVLFCFVLILFMPKKEYRIPMMLNLSIGMLLNLGIKHFVERMRPAMDTVLVVETGYSFPSGHTMAATCFYGFLIALLYRTEMKAALRYVLTGLLSLLIVLIGISRVYLGAHFFSDVLAGFCLSACLVIVNMSLVDRYFSHPEVIRKKEHASEHQQFFSSFRHAFDGVMYGMRTERNMTIHFAVLLLVVVFGVVLGLSVTEWMICLILFGLVIAAELMNTAIETVVDMITTEHDLRAKAAKDTAAGAVLVVSIAAALVGIIIFAPKLLTVIQSGSQVYWQK